MVADRKFATQNYWLTEPISPINRVNQPKVKV
jgi:hypothetical protein